MIISSEVKGFPRQLMEMWENNRCSILFHLEVAGGRWFTVMESPASFASCCSSFFHSRLRTPLEPPPSEVMRRHVFFGYSALPTLFHHRLMDSTAKKPCHDRRRHSRSRCCGRRHRRRTEPPCHLPG